MKNNKVCKLFLFTAAIFLSFEAFCQERSALLEKNLPDNLEQKNSPTEKQTTEVGDNPLPSPTKDALLSKSEESNGLASLLLGKKPASLMFDDEEISNIDRAVESLKNNQIYVPEGEDSLLQDESSKAKAELERIQKEKESQENEKSYIYLASLMYFNPKDWVIWINENKITSKNNAKEKELYVESVQKDQIKILWKLSVSKWKIISGYSSEGAIPKTNENNQIEIRFSLKPNQTFVLSTNTIVEGKALIALMKKKEEEKSSAKTSDNKPSQSASSSNPSNNSALLKKASIQ